MTEITLTDRSLHSFAQKALNGAAVFWFLAAVIGQLIFVYYVAAFYGGAAVQGNFAAWNKVLSVGYVPGNSANNLAVAAHLFLAVIVIIGGPLQLIPIIRARSPMFHRWNGRIYLTTVFLGSITGLVVTWIVGTKGGVAEHMGSSLNAILNIIFGSLALRYALARKFEIHRRWALRLFLAASAVWFWRVGLMFWVIINKGPAGFDPQTFTGPFLTFLIYAQYLVPLAVLELYLRTQIGAGTFGKLAMAFGLVVLTVAMGVGTMGATFFMWLPNI